MCNLKNEPNYQRSRILTAFISLSVPMIIGHFEEDDKRVSLNLRQKQGEYSPAKTDNPPQQKRYIPGLGCSAGVLQYIVNAKYPGDITEIKALRGEQYGFFATLRMTGSW